VGGVTLERFGMPVSFALTAIGLVLVAVVLVVSGRSSSRDRGSLGAADAVHDAPAEHASLRKAFTLVRRDPAIGLLTLTVIVVEVLGFSSITLLPSFARDIFSGGPDAYGVMSAIRSLGAALGLLLLIRVGARMTPGPMLMTFSACMGVALLGFAVAPSYWWALLPLALFGAAAASMDSLSQALMQRATADAERGAAMGLWTFAVGCGPFGHLAIGALAGRFGVVQTQLLFGGLLVAFSVAMLFLPRIRALR
jgi:predicted MFS family arabinose efflux permease